MSTSRQLPCYQLIDATPPPKSMRVDRTGTYASLAEANQFLNMRGPPLPIIIQIFPGQEDDLASFIELVKSVPNGDSNSYAGDFVKGVIEKIDSENVEVWPNNSPFYALVNGTRAAKYLAQEWRHISDVTSGTSEKTPSFSKFVHAFVWALAGGNQALSEWGLLNRWGWVSSAKGYRLTAGGPATLSTPNPVLSGRPGGSQTAPVQATSSPTTTPSRIRREPSPAATPPSSSIFISRRGPHPSSPTPQQALGVHGASIMGSGSESEASIVGSRGGGALSPGPSSSARGKNKEKPRRAPACLPIRGKNTQKPAPSVRIPPSPSNINAGSSHAPLAEPTAPRFCSPTTLFPLSVLSNRRFKSNSLPIICRRSSRFPGASETIWSANFRGSSEEMFLPAKTTLPSFIEFTLLAMGWEEGMMRVVQIAWSCGGNRDDFILTLGDAGIPLSEAYLVWILLERERVFDERD